MLEAATPVALSLLKQFAEQFASLTRFKSVEVLDQSQAQAVRGAIRRVAGPGITVLLPMGTAEANSDMARLNKKRAEVQAQLSGMADKMSMPGYETRVPVAIKEADRTRIELLNKELAAIDADVTELNSL
jgi:valyl-tRNA synthetase